MKIEVFKNWREVLAEVGETQAVNFFLSTEKTYVVYGVSVLGGYAGGKPQFEIADDDGNLISLPAIVATVVEDVCPNNWLVRMTDKGLFIWPKIFFRKFFFDDLSDGEPGAVRAFKELRAEIARVG